MTYEEKKYLYENIMHEIAKTVKKRLNESYSNETAQQWYALYDAKNNEYFAEKYSDMFKMLPNNKISTSIIIENIEQEFDRASVAVSADNVGLLMQKIDILQHASIYNIFPNNSFDIDIKQNLKPFMKKWRITFMDFHKDKQYCDIKEIDDIIEDLSAKMFYDNSGKNAQ